MIALNSLNTLTVLLALVASSVTNNNASNDASKSSRSIKLYLNSINCTSKMEEYSTIEAARRIESDTVRIVYLTVFTRSKQLYEVFLVDHIGKNILRWLNLESARDYPDILSMLNVGHNRYNLHLNESSKGCFENELNGIESVTKFVLKAFANNVEAFAYEVCYKYHETKGDEETRCCNITKGENSPQSNCVDVRTHDHWWVAAYAYMFSNILAAVNALLFQWFYVYSIAYQLSDEKCYHNRRSIFYFVQYFLWRGKGYVVALLRAVLLLSIVSLFFNELLATSLLFTMATILSFLFVFISYMPNNQICEGGMATLIFYVLLIPFCFVAIFMVVYLTQLTVNTFVKIFYNILNYFS